MNTWTTLDGKVLEIKWMQSAHLIHSINMVMRKNSFTQRQAKTVMDSQFNSGPVILGQLHDLLNEANSRRLLCWRPDDTLDVPKYRETPAQLCALRAVLGVFDEAIRGAYLDEFKRSPQGFVEALPAQLAAKFTEYRLERE